MPLQLSPESGGPCLKERRIRLWNDIWKEFESNSSSSHRGVVVSTSTRNEESRQLHKENRASGLFIAKTKKNRHSYTSALFFCWLCSVLTDSVLTPQADTYISSITTTMTCSKAVGFISHSKHAWTEFIVLPIVVCAITYFTNVRTTQRVVAEYALLSAVGQWQNFPYTEQCTTVRNTACGGTEYL